MADAVTTENAPEPRGPYPHVRIHGDQVWVTGQIGRDPASGDFVAGGFEPEFHQAITNLEAILEEAGSSLSQVVHTCVQFVNEDDLDATEHRFADRGCQRHRQVIRRGNVPEFADGAADSSGAMDAASCGLFIE